jgi:hypothetical protein
MASPSRDPAHQSHSNDLSGDSQLQTRTLECGLAAERYHRWLCSMALPYLGTSPIEFGSGLGNYAQWWLDNAPERIARLTVVERDASRLAHLQRRFAGEARIEVSDMDIYAPPSSPQRGHTSLVAYNFLEHVDHDSAALRAAHRLCQSGSPVVMFVPAFPFAFGKFDRLVGHRRRYTKSSLRSAFLGADLIPNEIHYVNAPGLLVWFVAVRLLGMTPTSGRLLGLWDTAVVPVARTIEERVRPPFGQSVFGVARVP